MTGGVLYIYILRLYVLRICWSFENSTIIYMKHRSHENFSIIHKPIPWAIINVLYNYTTWTISLLSQDLISRDVSINVKVLQIARPDSSQNFMDTVTTMDLTRLCMQINNKVVFSNHTHIKLIKKSKTKKTMSTVNRKYWVKSSFASHGSDYGHSW